jgi:hypothetical protein
VPFIPYPSIPNIPGIGLPQLPQPPAGFSLPSLPSLPVDTSSLDPSDTTSLDNTPTWSITDTSGKSLLQPDSVIDFEYRGEMKIPTYPIEGGSFQSYNKVPIPYDIRMTVACNGNGQQTRDEFLSACKALRESLGIAVINTPDDVYDSVNMIHFDYRREARQGVTLLLVQLWFQEIRVAPATAIAAPSQTNPVAGTPTPSTAPSPPTTAPSTAVSDIPSSTVTSPAQPDGASPQSSGQVSATTPTAAQAAPSPTPAPTFPPGYSQNSITGVIYDANGNADSNATASHGMDENGLPSSQFGPQRNGQQGNN